MSKRKKKVSIGDMSVQELEQLVAEKKKAEANEKKRDQYKASVEVALVDVVTELKMASNHFVNVKAFVFSQFKEILETKYDIYQIKSKQQSHTFSNDNCSVTIGYRVNDGWDDTVAEGVAKVREYIQSLSSDSKSATLVEMLFDLIKKDTKGNLRAHNVLKLQKHAAKSKDKQFNDGVQIILDAWRPVRSCWFIEASVKNDIGQDVGIPLSISAVDFPKDFEHGEFYRNL